MDQGNSDCYDQTVNWEFIQLGYVSHGSSKQRLLGKEIMEKE